jgi:hypothetical protein
MTRCEDGICRVNCPFFNGCPLSKPLHCPNGYCARNLGECAGESSCPLATPFRCINNKCVKEFN